MSRMGTLLAVMAAAAAAVLASAGAAAADIKGEAYADLDYGVDHLQMQGGGADTIFANHGSFWGFKGSTTANGMTAFGAFERWLSADAQDRQTSFLEPAPISQFPADVGQVDLTRQAFVGLHTDYGTLRFGQFTTAYADSGQKLDPFRGTAADGAGYQTGGVSHGQSGLAADRVAQGSRQLSFPVPTGFFLPAQEGGIVGNQVAYTAPTLMGLTANVAVMFDENSGAASRQEDYAAGIEWSGMGITAGAQYLDANSAVGNTGLNKGEEALHLYAGYSQERFGANVSAERVDYNGNTPNGPGTGRNANGDFLQANAWFGVLPNTRVAASYGKENETGNEGTSFRVGVFHDLMDNFTLNVVYANYDMKQEQLSNGNPDEQIISMGASYRFSIGATTTTH